MKLSPKAVRFVIEALEHYEAHHDRRLENNALTDDEISDLNNDREYLKAIRRDLEEYHGKLTRERIEATNPK